MTLNEQIRQAFFTDGKYDRRRARSYPNLVLQMRTELGITSVSVSEDVYRFMTGAQGNICVCGARTPFISQEHGFRKFCTTKCMHKDPEIKRRRSESIKQTCLAKYGVTNALGDPTIRAKVQSTILERYGVTNYAKTEMHRTSVRHASMEKYGVSHPLAAEEVKSKSAKTMMARHGGKYTMTSPSLKAKMEKTMVARYGASTAWKSSLLYKLHDWQRSRFLGSFTQHGFTLLNETNEKTILAKHKCGTEAEHEWFRRPRCEMCKHSSKPEQELYEFLAQHVDVKRNDRKIIKPRELDLVIPSKKIAIEMNGAYWHHDKSGKVPLFEKSNMTKIADYQLIHIWDYEWYYQRAAVENMLLSKLGIFQRRVSGRKCTVQSITKEQAVTFLDRLHLQGSCKSSVQLGLFYGDELLGVGTFGRSRFSKLGEYELLRMCFESGVQVHGGVGKLTKAASKQLSANIITYADARFSVGAGYIAAGYTPAGCTKPGYVWFTPKTGTINRYLTQKSRIAKLLGEEVDLSCTENELMRAAGFYKLIDCGHHRFVFKSQ